MKIEMLDAILSEIDVRWQKFTNIIGLRHGYTHLRSPDIKTFSPTITIRKECYFDSCIPYHCGKCIETLNKYEIEDEYGNIWREFVNVKYFMGFYFIVGEPFLGAVVDDSVVILPKKFNKAFP